MRVRALRSMSGPHETYTIGKIYRVADGRAEKLVGRGFAVAVDEPVELTIDEPEAEITTKYRRRKK